MFHNNHILYGRQVFYYPPLDPRGANKQELCSQVQMSFDQESMSGRVKEFFSVKQSLLGG